MYMWTTSSLWENESHHLERVTFSILVQLRSRRFVVIFIMLSLHFPTYHFVFFVLLLSAMILCVLRLADSDDLFGIFKCSLFKMYDIEFESHVFRRKELQCIFKYFWFDVVVCGNDNLDHANQEIIISSGRILRKVKKKKKIIK